MESAKPIEPGCKALIINLTLYLEKNKVTVGQRLTGIDYLGNIVWEIDKKLIWVNSETKGVKCLNICPEKNLMRIDGPDIQSQIEAEESVPVLVS